MINVLAAIVEHKRQVIANLPDFTQLEPSQRGFHQALSKPHFGFIMECKKASPSKGLIREDFRLEEIVPIYDQYADAISVLTEERFFRGSFHKLQQARQLTDKPLLCKDFILVPKQVRQARYYGADAVLLMLSVLNDEDYLACLEQAEALNMDVLTEVHSEQELERAIRLGSKIIGINNRNLKNLSTDLAHSERLAAKVPADRLLVSESGINSHQDVLQLSRCADACLVGSSLMQQADLELAARQLVFGDIKVCGVTQQADADMLEQFPVSSIGLIFAPDSKRCIGDTPLQSAKPLVGVFQDQPIDTVAAAAEKFALARVQLHGDESAEYIAALRKRLPVPLEISKVLHLPANARLTNQQLADLGSAEVDEVLLDSVVVNGNQQQRGGTGQRFNWGLLSELKQSTQLGQVRVAGGVSADNVQQLKQLGITRLDLSSSVESEPGVKCRQKLQQFFAQARPLSYRKQLISFTSSVRGTVYEACANSFDRI